MSQITNYEYLLQRLMKLDENIRFAAVANTDGTILSSDSKPNTELYLSPEDTEETIQHAISAWKSRKKYHDQIGEGVYTLSVYQKLRRATIPLPSGNMLLVTIDNLGGQQQIMDKILNEVNVHDYTVSPAAWQYILLQFKSQQIWFGGTGRVWTHNLVWIMKV